MSVTLSGDKRVTDLKLDLLKALNAADHGLIPIQPQECDEGLNRIYKIGPWTVVVFDDGGEWDYIDNAWREDGEALLYRDIHGASGNWVNDALSEWIPDDLDRWEL